MKSMNGPDNKNQPIFKLWDRDRDMRILVNIGVYFIVTATLLGILWQLGIVSIGKGKVTIWADYGLSSVPAQPIISDINIAPTLCQAGTFSTSSADEVEYNTLMSKDVFVQYIRLALTDFLSNNYATNTEGYNGPLGLVDGIHRKDTAYGDLLTIDKAYLKSKFIVLQSDTAPGGGAWIILIFKDYPDRVFFAWVYDYYDSTTDRNDGFDLRAFGEQTEGPSIGTVQEVYANQLCDPSFGI